MRPIHTAPLLPALLALALLGPACTKEAPAGDRPTSGAAAVAPPHGGPAAPPPAPAAPAASQPTAAAAAPGAPGARDATTPQPFSAGEMLQTPAAGSAPAAPTPFRLGETEPQAIFVDSEPPDPVYQPKPRKPGLGYLWIPGFWDWTGARWEWRPGAWQLRPAGRVFSGPHYELLGGRLVYVRPYWATQLTPRYYGGRIVGMRYQTRAPAWWRPAVPYVVRPTIGYRLGSRPAAVYRTLPKISGRLVVPPRGRTAHPDGAPPANRAAPRPTPKGKATR
jgi:hypothetical protein